MLIGIVLGLCVGLIMGLTGAGGGILAIPALMYGMGVALTDARPIALIAVGLAAMVGSFHGLRLKLLRYRAALVLALAGGLVVPFGMALGHQLSPVVLHCLFSVVMVIVGVRMLFSGKELTLEKNNLVGIVCAIAPDSGRFIWTPKTFFVMVAIGLVAGFFTGLLGVGGGFIVVPALLAVSPLSFNSAVATSLMVVALNSLVAVVLALQDGVALTIPIELFILCTVSGLFIGRILGKWIPAQWVRYGFSALCFSIAIVMSVQL